MDFKSISNRILLLCENSDSNVKYLITLYQNLFSKIDATKENDFKTILNVSEKLLSMFLQRHDYESVMQLYKIEHNFFSKEFPSHHSQEISNLLKPDVISEEGLPEILDYLLYSFELINNRWNNALKMLSNISKKEESPALESAIKNDLQPLLMKSNFHFIHSVMFLKHNFKELKEVYKKINDLSLIDPLTGLKNRRYFYMTYENIFYIANRRKIPICFVMMDIDDFKTINDRYGHYKGDEVLQKISVAITYFLRKSDIIIRFGGDEILLLLIDLKGNEAKELIDEVLKRIENIKISHKGKSFKVTMSAGIFCQKIESLSKVGTLESVMLKQADTALYQSNNTGKNK